MRAYSRTVVSVIAALIPVYGLLGQGVPPTAEAQVAAARAVALSSAKARSADAARTADALLTRALAVRAKVELLRQQLQAPGVAIAIIVGHSGAVATSIVGLDVLAETGVVQATLAAAETASDASRVTANASVVGALARKQAIVSASALVLRAIAAQSAASDDDVRILADSVVRAGEALAVATTELAGLVASTAIEATTPALAVLAGSDNEVLEALRVRIVGGSIFSNGQASVVKSADGKTASVQSSQFAQAAVYLAFESQPRVFGWSCWFACDTLIKRQRAEGDASKRVDYTNARASLIAQEDRGYDRFYLDPAVSLRLTTIAVTGASSSTTAGDEIQSKKAAQVIFGATSTFNFGGFNVNKTRFHWGFGPVGRAIFQSVSDGQRSARVWNLEDDLFGSWAVGGRLTLFEKDRKAGDLAQHGWAPAAYVDYSYGQFQNFETATARDTSASSAATVCLRDPATCLATGVPPQSAFVRGEKWRHYIEARIFLQYVYLGLDLNNGSGPDDLRFIGGVSMRLDQFFSRR
ncbi:MAG: hypothetical protein IT355_11350 [Gemmatimonadaceae bacterium]|nr:hypothetical protein [Gemmatimonadaceae bacterium]